MKKVLKSRIFLCIIVGICCLGIGVYGANEYKANEISYNPSNGEATNVNEALNELYNIKNNNKYIVKTTEKIVRSSKSDSPYSGTSFFKTGLSGYTLNENIFLLKIGMSEKYTTTLNDIIAYFYGIDSDGVARVSTGNTGQYWDYVYFIYLTDKDGNPA